MSIISELNFTFSSILSGNNPYREKLHYHDGILFVQYDKNQKYIWITVFNWIGS